MSQHPSLKSSKVGKKLRSVLKRYERFFALKDKGLLYDESSVFGLPKLKIVRTKIKKEKAAEKPEEGAVTAAGAEGTPAATPQKETAPKADKKAEKKK